MPFTLTMPKLSPTMEEGTIAKWRKKEGDYVKAGDVLFEVATDKATVEHSALDAGFIRKILIKEGESAIVNQPLAIFTEKQDESIEGYKPEGELPKAAEPKAAAAEASAKEAAPAAKPAAAGAMMQPAFVPEPPLTKYEFSGPEGEIEGRIPASPLAKKLAQEKGIDLTTVKGTGPHGRIMSRDLDLGQPSGPVTFGRRETPTIAPGTYEEIPLSHIRKIIGQRLQESKTFIPHFYTTQEILADKMVSLRAELSTVGLKVSYNDFILRATALALREHPNVNSGFNSVNQSIIRFKTIDISVAVSVSAGLITPIIRHADFKNLGQLSQEMKVLAAKARDGKLMREEYTGGSFTVSNLGMFGISEFVAIINPPQAAILAIGGLEDRAVVKEGQVVPGKTMRITLSADHRVLDGADAAKFLKTVQKYLENPSLLLL
ncbi:MAG: pyruvate dehydrogenase complex dihydrolipoamide acetyltransferase [Verrucomicrobia bacterium]|nr:pyruvate dehydrogenase complex dihydrolipoamide acetyltransferase [Verrucomicrobiota bacterium]